MQRIRKKFLPCSTDSSGKNDGQMRVENSPFSFFRELWQALFSCVRTTMGVPEKGNASNSRQDAPDSTQWFMEMEVKRVVEVFEGRNPGFKVTGFMRH